MKAWEAATGCPVMINTSFNVRGEPIVCSPEHAYRCFMATNMDVLVMADCLLLKDEQPVVDEFRRDEYLAEARKLTEQVTDAESVKTRYRNHRRTAAIHKLPGLQQY